MRITTHYACNARSFSAVPELIDVMKKTCKDDGLADVLGQL